MQEQIPGVERALDAAASGNAATTALVVGVIALLVAIGLIAWVVRTLRSAHSDTVEAYKDALEAKNKDNVLLIGTLKETQAAMHSLGDNLRNYSEPLRQELAAHDRHIAGLINQKLSKSA
jgi:hypothetical protein